MLKNLLVRFGWVACLQKSSSSTVRTFFSQVENFRSLSLRFFFASKNELFRNVQNVGAAVVGETKSPSSLNYFKNSKNSVSVQIAMKHLQLSFYSTKDKEVE